MKTTHHTSAQLDDPVLQELWQTKDRLSQQQQNDPAQIVADHQRSLQTYRGKHVSVPFPVKPNAA